MMKTQAYGRTLFSRSLSLTAAAALAVTFAPRASAQSVSAFGVCVPRANAAPGTVGCFEIVDKPVGVVGSKPVYWFVSRLSKKRSATATDSMASTVIDAFGHSWLLAIGTRNQRPREGKPVARIGPLPVTPGYSYSALYMEASMRPGMKSKIHRHSGPEAWYTLSGQTCLETSAGTTIGRAGGPPVIVPGGLPMELTATGAGIRKSIVLILHRSEQPPTTMETKWKPTGVCSRNLR